MNKIKYLFSSKTIVFNLIVSLAAVAAYFYPPASELVTANAVLIMAFVGACNVILRRVTKDAYAFFPLIILALCLTSLSSCTPTGYLVNTKPYADVIASSPERVLVDRAHVEEVGGFQANIGGTVETDFGWVTVDKNGVSTDLVIDATSGK